MINIIDQDNLHLSIEWFGPIKSAELNLKNANFNVLIGPNMGGKSSIFNALLLVSNVVSSKNNIQQRLMDHSYRQRLINGDSPDNIAIIKVSFHPTKRFFEKFLTKGSISVSSVDTRDVLIIYTILIHPTYIRETLNAFNSELRKEICLASNDDFNDFKAYGGFSQDALNFIYGFNEEDNQKEFLERGAVRSSGGRNNSLLSMNLGEDDTNPIAESLRNYFELFLYMSPKRIPSNYGEVLSDIVLQYDGKNVCSILHYLQSNHKKVLKTIIEGMKTIFPTVSDINSKIIGSNQVSVIVSFRGQKNSYYEVTIDELSTGFIEVLILLTFYFSSPKNTILLIEEIERSLHPKLQKDLLYIFLSNIDNRTIYLATHSSHLLQKNLNNERSWFFIKDGKMQALDFTSKKEWDDLNSSLGIDPKNLFFSKGIIFSEGPSESALSLIIELDAEINPQSIDIVSTNGKSVLKHKSFSEFLKFLAMYEIPTLICFDEDAKGSALEFVRINDFIDKTQLIIWKREFEEALDFSNYISVCKEYSTRNSKIKADDIENIIKKEYENGNGLLLSKAAKKVFRTLELGSFNKPEVARKTTEEMISNNALKKSDEFPKQIVKFLEKLEIFHS